MTMLGLSNKLAKLGIFLILLLGSSFSVLAESDRKINKGETNIAILGYDPVAYFTEGGPVEGKEELSYIWQDAEWRFSTTEHRDVFAGDPERYAPRYGGFCAGGMAMGFILRIDPQAWVIIDDKLYLNYDHNYTNDFVADAPNEIRRANANWEQLGRVE